jgi:hypothetical protein
VSYSGLAPATHVFGARAIDGSDNEDPTPATYTWKVLEPASAAAAGFVLAPAEERTATAMAGHYRVLAACAAACRVGAKLTLGKTALGHGAARRRAAGTSTVLVKLGKRGRAALRHRGSARVKLTITLTQGRSKLTVKRTVALRRGAGLQRIAAHGLRYVAAVTRASRLSGKLTIGAAQARKIGLGARGRKRVTVAGARINATRAPRLLVLRVTGRPRRALARAKRVAALLEAVAGKTGQPRRSAKLGKTLVR